MKNAYETLGIAPDANEAAIRARYLELVRQFPPEREPQKAAEIRAAYDALRDPVIRLKRLLFDVHSAQTFEGLIEAQKRDVCEQRLSTDLLLSLERQ